MAQELQANFDFFDIRNDGELPDVAQVRSADGVIKTIRFSGGFVESFEFGWNVQTTYRIYRERVEALLGLAEQHEHPSTTEQALLASALVLSVSGLEVLVCVAGGLDRAPCQSIDDFIRAVEKIDGYAPIDPKDRAPLGRLFEVRHAIVHCGWRLTKPLQGRIDSRGLVQDELLFHLPNVRRIVEAADRFAEAVAECFRELDVDRE